MPHTGKERKDIMTNEERRFIIDNIEEALQELSQHDGKAERKTKRILKRILEAVK